jgi:FKBP-type peptidyl-prolyl cis-trans isomerase
MNFSKQEWVTLGVGIIVIIGVILLLKTGPVSTTQQKQIAMSQLSTGVKGENISKDPRIQIIEVQKGTGTEAVNGKTVYVHYTGTFTDGKKFDSSLDRGQPLPFVLGSGNVIKGWDMGILGMKVGGKRHLVISPELAYGSQANGPIPANSTLIFDVELMDVK